MVNLGELETAVFGGQVGLLFASCVTRLKNDARELEVLREEIAVVIARTARYLSRPLPIRNETIRESLALK
jgi:hypothetical protein